MEASWQWLWKRWHPDQRNWGCWPWQESCAQCGDIPAFDRHHVSAVWGSKRQRPQSLGHQTSVQLYVCCAILITKFILSCQSTMYLVNGWVVFHMYLDVICYVFVCLDDYVLTFPVHKSDPCCYLHVCSFVLSSGRNGCCACLGGHRCHFSHHLNCCLEEGNDPCIHISASSQT